MRGLLPACPSPHPHLSAARFALYLFLTLAGILTAILPASAAEGAPGALPPSVRIKPLLVPVVNGGRIEKYTQWR